MISPEKVNEKLQHLNHAIKANPKNFDALAYRGLLHLRLGKDREVLEDSEAALLLVPELPQARVLHVMSLASVGEVANALVELDRLTLAYPRDPYLRTARGHCLILQKRFDEAIVVLSEQLRLFPVDVWAQSERAIALSALGKGYEAEQDLISCARLDAVLGATTEKRMKAVREMREQNFPELESGGRKER